MDASHQLDGMPPRKRPKNEKETPAEGEADRISDLPEGVLQHLLSLMPAHDAVRTCVLAQRWRHLWRSAPAIRFTNEDWFGSAVRFNQFVDRLLRLRRHGAPLESCELHLAETELYSAQFLAANERRLSRWIWRALRRKVRMLRFGFVDPISLPNMPLVSQHLTTLELHCVDANGRVLDFSGCPALADLVMSFCFMNSATISSSSLKHLKMIGGTFREKHRTRISLPNLVSLELNDILGRVPLLESMPSLATATVRIAYEPADRCNKGGSGDCGDDACDGCRYYYGSQNDRRHGGVFLASLSQATSLELSADSDMLVFKRDLKWCSTFSKLRTLVLSKWFVTDDLGALIWFLQHSPVLEKLTLQISEVHKISAGRYGPVEQLVASDHIELVEIKCREIDQMVVAILKILNDSRIPLEKIQIHKYSSFGCFKFVCTGFNPNERMNL
uniref:Uncharacterized protein n=1 Tax=Avena sativa TaxID=4498 RepID=A0ACD6A1X7_AVESA